MAASAAQILNEALMQAKPSGFERVKLIEFYSGFLLTAASAAAPAYAGEAQRRLSYIKPY